ncbi:hypothetical protein M501DRAFT_923307, partial [Patellaria atrata CBS 101060]
YDANCNCGALQFRVKLSPALGDQKVTTCNCSICLKNGYLFLYSPNETIEVVKG